ncbi:hypothetical protein [Streptomyces sp. 891-h]|uniref:hypothetical protein n=1 Tax=Streptomyces sp. 891-h TaxID=2720714 RepID=UPI001FAAC433|nr:hypothetical protein [Streptomyces sp. 891-h]UNZ22304.1 hypothetical protein HC362_34620 [Streptomyces sp. 891-h]
MSTTLHTAPRTRIALDGDLVNDAACTLVELSTVPDDEALQDRAAAQLAPLTATLRRITGTDNAEAANDADWLNAWRGCGIVRERTR